MSERNALVPAAVAPVISRLLVQAQQQPRNSAAYRVSRAPDMATKVTKVEPLPCIVSIRCRTYEQLQMDGSYD